ncbi:Lrp/AsnC family transcriptional regulator [Roseibium sp. HPY-6]|uniref:Lrp/AsnC family transcriptional regulator n=1 Tax=Roseibium sp. HPY-6 TaxID=3229852 RepID=UPI00338FD478
MSRETKNFKRSVVSERSPDGFDRKILSVLVTNAETSFAELGRIVGLSAPAVFERVKRLKKSGAIRAVCALLHGPSVDRPFLAFVHVDVAGWGKEQKMLKLADFPEVEEMHSVAGDTGLIIKVRTRDSHALEQLLAQIYDLPGVTGTKSYVVLSTFLERPVQAETTEEWPTVSQFLPPQGS